MKLVTIVCESVLEERVISILRAVGAHGHTAFAVHGSGHQGDRAADIAELANVQVQVIVKATVSEALLTKLRDELFNSYAMVAYESDVRVMRPEKF